MKNKSLFKLMIVNYSIFLTGMGLLPLLPLYALDFGISATGTGLYMAMTYVAITAGSLLTNRMAARLGHKKLFFAAGMLGVFGLILLGQVTTFWQLVLLTAVVWFSGGIGIAQVSIFTGMLAKRDGRGKAFSLTFLALPLASISAGLAVGALEDAFGFSAVFIALALAMTLWPLIALFGLEQKMIPEKAQKQAANSQNRTGWGSAFTALLLATLLAATTGYIARFGTSLSMQALSFSKTAVSSTSAVGGLAMIPLALSFGALSDKFGRKRFLSLGYILGAMGAILLAASSQLWQFWLAAGLINAALSANGAIAPALASDLLSQEERNRGLPTLNVMRNIAGIIGFAIGGYLIDAAGPYGLYGVAAFLALAAVPILVWIRPQQKSIKALDQIFPEHSRRLHWFPVHK